MFRKLTAVFLLLATAAIATEEKAVPSAKEPDRIVVQHILIGFAGSVRGKSITRTRAEAETLAQEILAKAKAGGDFDALVKKYTDDSHPGIYAMVNSGLQPQRGPDRQEFSRDRMVPAFGNVGFAVGVGEVGLAPHDAKTSPYGWHIIKRLE